MKSAKLDHLHSPEPDTCSAGQQNTVKSAAKDQKSDKQAWVEFDLLKYWHNHRQWLLQPVLHR